MRVGARSVANVFASFRSNRLLVILAIGFLWRLVLITVFPYSVAADGVFQTIEPAHHLAFGHWIQVWEWKSGIRSWIYPGILGLIMKLASLISSSPVVYMAFIHVFTISFSLIPVYVVYRVVEKYDSQNMAAFAALLVCFWYEFTFYAPSTLNGVLPAHLLVLACYLLFFSDEEKKNVLKFISAGVIFAFVSIVRFHLVPEIALIVLYAFFKRPKSLVLYGLISYILVFTLAGLLDWYTWSYPFQSIIKNIYLNIYQHVSQRYGVKAFYYYLIFLLQSWNIFFIPILFFACYGVKRMPIYFYIGLLNILSFSFIAHKEYRFIYLFDVCFFVLAVVGFIDRYNYYKKHRQKLRKIAFCCVGLWLCMSLAYAIMRAHHYMMLSSLYVTRIINNDYNGKVNSIYLNGIELVRTGGYAYLNLKAPIVFMPPSLHLSAEKTKYPSLIIARRKLHNLKLHKIDTTGRYNAYITYNKVSV